MDICLLSKEDGNPKMLFKFETNSEGIGQVNIGLGNGKALKFFNNNIKDFKVLKK